MTDDLGPVQRNARARILLLGVAAIGIVLLGLVALTIASGPARQTETGVVIAVEATGLTNIQGFSIRTPAGRTITFRLGRLENAASFPPGHLAEHKVSLVPVVVTYIEEAGTAVAVRLDDAPSPPPPS